MRTLSIWRTLRYLDWELLRKETLEPLARREPARFRCFNWVAGAGRTDAVVVEARDVSSSVTTLPDAPTTNANSPRATPRKRRDAR
jgi:hypothetical protein